jgi:ABC-type multidrug transport system ATPase subunit
VIDLVGLREVANRRAGAFSLGMGQRLGVASALLGDPATLILDEPVNGLAPEGIRWIRNLMRALAAEGRTVFVSSRLMSEMSLTADHLIVVGKGRLIADMSVTEFINRASPSPPGPDRSWWVEVTPATQPATRSADRPNRRSHSRPGQPACREPARSTSRQVIPARSQLGARAVRCWITSGVEV